MRRVAIDAEQAALLEEIGERMLREQDERATKILALTLAYRYAAFECEIDESAGLAEVVQLGEYSRKVDA